MARPPHRIPQRRQNLGETTQKWERDTRQKVIAQGGSPPPKLRSEENLFVDDHRQHVPRYNQAASDDLAFRTGRRQDSIVSSAQTQPIHIHPNTFARLQDPMDTYRDFIPESYPEDHPAPPAIRAPAQPKSSKPKQKGKRLRSFKDEDITDKERDYRCTAFLTMTLTAA
jgi:hypothetical protein